jgi:hypothetical protein
MRWPFAASSLVDMTSDFLLASPHDGGASMIWALLIIGLVGLLVYLVAGRRGSNRNDASGRSSEE